MLEQLARRPQRDEVLEGVGALLSLLPGRRDDLRAIERPQARLGHVEELGDLAAREEVGHRLAAVGRRGDARGRRAPCVPVASPRRPPPEPKATWMTFASPLLPPLRAPFLVLSSSVVRGMSEREGHRAGFAWARLSINGAWTSTSILTPRESGEIRISHETRPRPTGGAERRLAAGHAHGAKAHVGVARDERREEARLGASLSGAAIAQDKARRAVPHAPAASRSARSPRSRRPRGRRARASGSRARARGSSARASTNGSSRALARPGRVTDRIVAGRGLRSTFVAERIP